MTTRAGESTPRLRATRPARVTLVVTLLAVQVLLGQAAVAFAPAGASISAFWPNAALTVVALCFTAPRWQPAVLAAAYVVAVLANDLGGRTLEMSAALGVINVLEPLVVFWWLSHGTWTRPKLRTMDEFVRLIGATVIGAVLAGLLAAASISTLGTGDPLDTWRAVTASHGAALLVLVPLGLRLPRTARLAGPRELVAQAVLLALATVFVFSPGQQLPLAFAPYPLLIWGAARLSPRDVALQLIGFSVLASSLTSAGFGPFVESVEFAGAPPELVGTLLQANLVAAALITIPLTLVRTQQVKAHEDLTHSHDLVSNILGSATSTAILGTSLDGRLEFFNVGAERLTGHRAEDVVGRAAVAVVTAEDGGEVLALVDAPDPDRLTPVVAPLLNGEANDMTGDWRIRRADGELRTASVVISRRFGEDGVVVGYLGVAEDVTERRRQEAAVQEALEHETQLVERLAQVDRTKNDFLASVSHELRTPITSILGYAQLLQSAGSGTPPTDADRQLVQRIERNGRRLLGLIEDMLMMSQVEVGSFHLRREPLDLREPVRRAAESGQGSVEHARLTFEGRLPAHPVPISGDAEKLERVFGNLLSNAAKFSNPGDAVVVELSVDGDYACVTVSDTGLGISPEEQARLFDPFFRGADAHTLAIQGVGLGLPVAGSIVAGHDGTIHVESELGTGSTFVVRLPLLRERGATG